MRHSSASFHTRLPAFLLFISTCVFSYFSVSAQQRLNSSAISATSLRITAQVFQDVNNNGTIDKEDTLLTGWHLKLCPLDSIISGDAKGRFTLDWKEYTGPFPLTLALEPHAGLLQSLPMSAGFTIKDNGEYSCDFLVRSADMDIVFSGFHHEVFDDATGQLHIQEHDSMLVLHASNTFNVAINALAQEWRMTTLIEPVIASLEPYLFLTAYGEEGCLSMQPVGQIHIGFSSGEIITPDFSMIGSDRYKMTIYHEGQPVFSEERSGDAVFVPHNVRTWQFRGDAISMIELLPTLIQIAGGNQVMADSIVFQPHTPGTVQRLSRVLLTGFRMDSLRIFDESIHPFGIDQRGFGKALLEVDSAGSQIKVTAGEKESGILLRPVQSSGLSVHWSRGAGTPAGSLFISARGSSGSVGSKDLGRIGIAGKNGLFQCIIDLSSFGSIPDKVRVLNQGEEVGTYPIQSEVVATFPLMPDKGAIRVRRDSSCFVLGWPESLTLALSDGTLVKGNELRIPARAAAQDVYRLTECRMGTQNAQAFIIDQEHNDPARGIPLTQTITIIGKVFDDRNADGAQELAQSELGRGGRTIVFMGDDPMTQITTATTDGAGNYNQSFTTGGPGWAPVWVLLNNTSGWIQITPNYDLVSMGQVNQNLFNIDFGEKEKKKFDSHEKTMNSGKEDGFDTKDGGEPASMDSSLQRTIRDGNGESLPEFDTLSEDHFFVQSFRQIMPDTSILLGAQLRMRLRAATATAYNDEILLQLAGRNLWSRSIASLTTQQTWLSGQDAEISLDLAGLPVSVQQTTNILSFLRAGNLDLIVGDDTGVDYISLIAEYGAPLATGVSEQTDMSELMLFPPASTGSGSGNIEFSLVHSAFTTLLVVDEAGREIARLVNNTFLPAGRHTVFFTLPAVSSGVYRIVLSSGDHLLTQPLCILR